MRLEGRTHDLFVSRAMTRSYVDGAELIAAEEPGATVILVLEGQVRVLAHSSDGKVIDFNTLGPGEVIGEIAALDTGPRTASVVADGPVRASTLSPMAFRQLLTDEPEFALFVAKTLAERVRSLTERVIEFSTLLVRERLIRELLRRAPREGGDGPLRISPAPTHFDLAARISTHREQVSREMSRLSKQGLVIRSDGALVIGSRSALADAFADEGKRRG